MGLLKEFKTFAMRGNVIDMAVGVIIGGAFGKIITSLVSDLFMPIISGIIGGINISGLKWTIVGTYPSLLDPSIMMPAVTLNYGNFLQVLLDFIIIAFCIFMLIKGMNKLSNLRAKEEVVAPDPEPPAPSKEEVLLTEIRDLLKEKR